MHKALVMEVDACTGCHQCEMMCSYGKVGAFNPAKSVMDITIFDGGVVNVPSTCTQCEEAWCMVVCPVEAITLNPVTGAKEVSAEVCVGCKVCTIACPFGAINYDPDTGVVAKCDLCGRQRRWLLWRRIAPGTSGCFSMPRQPRVLTVRKCDRPVTMSAWLTNACHRLERENKTFGPESVKLVL